MSRDFEKEYQELEEIMRKEAAVREDAQACIHKCKSILARMQDHYRGAQSDDLLSGLGEQFQKAQRETDRYFEEQDKSHRREWERITNEECQAEGRECHDIIRK